MLRINRRSILSAWFTTAVLLGCGMITSAMSADDAIKPTPATDNPLVIVVMDPLSDKLACDCVEGYAQRKYEVLGQHLQQSLGRKVEVFWGESIAAALKDENAKRSSPLVANLVIGKHSVIATESKERELELQPVAQLTGKDGSTMQYGLVVVRGPDPAILVEDLEGYRFIFGPANCDEKSAAPRRLLLDAEIELPAELEIADACSVAAKRMLECPKDEKVAAIISSYAAPLLEGCGTINKGDLRVVGQSDPVPFITAFLPEKTAEPLRSEILAALTAASKDSMVLQALETRDGFVPYSAVSIKTDDSANEQVAAEKKTK